MISRLEVVDSRRASTGCPFARDALLGLSARPKRLPSSYFYDDRGSRLFQRITRLEEYYLTRCEREILQTYAGEISDAVGDEPFRLVEAGAGDGQKTEILLREFVRRRVPMEYSPIDICRPALVQLLDRLRAKFTPGAFRMHALAGDYFDALRVLRTQNTMRNLVLFLGSSIGNFNHDQATQFLRRLRRTLRPGDLTLIGFDLKKELPVMQAAYDDSLGVTREFNLNLLERMNRELDADFDREAFSHRAAYNSAEGCMESFLVSRDAATVTVGALDRQFRFAAGEAMQVESSYKYDLPTIERFAAECGFRVRQHFFDRRHYFTDSLWEAVDK